MSTPLVQQVLHRQESFDDCAYNGTQGSPSYNGWSVGQAANPELSLPYETGQSTVTKKYLSDFRVTALDFVVHYLKEIRDVWGVAKKHTCCVYPLLGSAIYWSGMLPGLWYFTSPLLVGAGMTCVYSIIRSAVLLYEGKKEIYNEAIESVDEQLNTAAGRTEETLQDLPKSLRYVQEVDEGFVGTGKVQSDIDYLKDRTATMAVQDRRDLPRQEAMFRKLLRYPVQIATSLNSQFRLSQLEKKGETDSPAATVLRRRTEQAEAIEDIETPQVTSAYNQLFGCYERPRRYEYHGRFLSNLRELECTEEALKQEKQFLEHDRDL